MTQMMDSTNPLSIPTDCPVVGGYDDGRFAWSVAGWNRFPFSKLVHITAIPKNNLYTSQVCDCESGDFTPIQAAQWARSKLAGGHGRPTIYCSTSLFSQVQQALQGVGLNIPGDVDWWEADYNNNPAISSNSVAHQYQGSVPSPIGVGVVDMTNTNGIWPGSPTVSPGPNLTGEEVVDFTPSGNGYWVCNTTNGAIFSYGDAQYLGAMNYPTNVLISGDVVTGFSSHPTSQGYIMSTQKGYVYAFGASPYYGSPASGAKIEHVGAPLDVTLGK